MSILTIQFYRNGGKRFITIIALISIVSLVLLSCSPSEYIATKIRTQKGQVRLSEEHFKLVNSEGKSFDINELDEVLAPVFDSETQNIIFHVHGAGYYPKMAFWLDEFDIMKRKYKAEVVLFSWPAFIDFRSIPRANAQASGVYLKELLQNIDAFRSKNPVMFDDRNVTLTLHRMAAEVMRSYLIKHHTGFDAKLFDSIILIAPEVDLRGHAEWLEKIEFSNRTFVVMNSGDRTLNLVKLHTDEARLGMQISHLDGKMEKLAHNVDYIIADKAVTDHKYHLKDHTKDFEHLLKSIIENDRDIFSSPFLFAERSNVYRVID